MLLPQLPVREEFDAGIQGGILRSTPGLAGWYFLQRCEVDRWSGWLFPSNFCGYPAVCAGQGQPSRIVLSWDCLGERAEWRCFLYHQMHQPCRRVAVSFLPHPLRSSGKDFGRFPHKFVRFLSRLLQTDRAIKSRTPPSVRVAAFLFASAVASGVRALQHAGHTCRGQFTIAAVLFFGFGNLLVPKTLARLFDGACNPWSGLKGLLGAVRILSATLRELRSPQLALLSRANNQLADAAILLAGLVATVLSLGLPQEEKPLEEH